MSNGCLVLRTEHRDVQYGSKEYKFVSGWVDTSGKVSQTFGKYVVRAKLPNPDAYGIWPAHWLMPEPNQWNCWPIGGEIDIMEATGGEQNNTVYGTYHWGQNATSQQLEKGECKSGCGCDTRFGRNGKFQPSKMHNFFFVVQYLLRGVGQSKNSMVRKRHSVP